jgi:hypothetical protein
VAGYRKWKKKLALEPNVHTERRWDRAEAEIWIHANQEICGWRTRKTDAICTQQNVFILLTISRKLAEGLDGNRCQHGPLNFGKINICNKIICKAELMLTFVQRTLTHTMVTIDRRIAIATFADSMINWWRNNWWLHLSVLSSSMLLSLSFCWTFHLLWCKIAVLSEDGKM